MIYVGIDNGVTGSIGIIEGDEANMCLTPVFKELGFQKTIKRHISRIDHEKLLYLLSDLDSRQCFVGFERPLVNPQNFQSTCSAMRSLESTLLVIEKLKLPFEYIDSKGWQKMLLPPVKGSTALKEASTQIGIRLFPHLRDVIESRGDADGILIAEYLKRRNV